jgi:hypothetical protein
MKYVMQYFDDDGEKVDNFSEEDRKNRESRAMIERKKMIEKRQRWFSRCVFDVKYTGTRRMTSSIQLKRVRVRCTIQRKRRTIRIISQVYNVLIK